jgi:WD40 repeat protein
VDKSIRIWNVADGKPVKKLDGHPDDVYSVAWNPDGTRLASIGYGGNLYVWDAETGKPLFHQKIAPRTLSYGVAWSPDGKQLAIAASDNKGYIFEVP